MGRGRAGTRERLAVVSRPPSVAYQLRSYEALLGGVHAELECVSSYSAPRKTNVLLTPAPWATAVWLEGNLTSSLVRPERGDGCGSPYERDDCQHLAMALAVLQAPAASAAHAALAATVRVRPIDQMAVEVQLSDGRPRLCRRLSGDIFIGSDVESDHIVKGDHCRSHLGSRGGCSAPLSSAAPEVQALPALLSGERAAELGERLASDGVASLYPGHTMRLWPMLVISRRHGGIALLVQLGNGSRVALTGPSGRCLSCPHPASCSHPELAAFAASLRQA